MKKKLLMVLLATVGCLVLAFGLAACENNGGTHEHSYSKEWLYDETYHWHPATCEHTGEVAYKAEHTPAEAVIENKVAATCTTEGSYDEVVYCSVCKYEISRETKTISVSSHENMIAYPAIEATCVAEGNSAYWYCPDCNKYFSDAYGQNEIPEGSWITAVTPHSGMVEHAAVEATCTAEGNSAYWECLDCGLFFSDAEGIHRIEKNSWIIPVGNHNYGTPVWTWKGFDSATATFICSNDPEHVEVIAAQITSDIVQVLDCETDGIIEYTATVYGFNGSDYRDIKEETISAPGHKWMAPIWSMTDDTTVVAKFICMTDQNHTKELEATKTSSTVIKEASCWESGHIRHTFTVTLDGKDYTYDSDEYLPTTPHSFSTDWSMDEFYHWHEAVCGHELKNDFQEHSFQDGKCTVCGYAATYTLGLEYRIENYSVAYVTGIGTVTDTNIVIPENYLGYKVIGIDDSAFKNCTFVTSVEIPDGVSYIGSNAFEDCSSLNSVNIPSGATRINRLAFKGCVSLDSVNIPSGVTQIEESAFEGCTMLTSATIESGVKRIAFNAFKNCSSLTCVELPDSIENIYSNAFTGCALRSLTIPKSVIYIDTEAFKGCAETLESISVQSGNTKYRSIDNCLIDIASKCLLLGCRNSQIPSDGSVETIGNVAFINCKALTSLVIPNSITFLNFTAFEGCDSIVSITIPSSVNSIYGKLNSPIEYAILPIVAIGGINKSCIKTLTINCGDTVSGLRDCVYLTDVTICDGVKSIGASAFYGCTSLTTIVIPDSVTDIGDYAFMDCTSLTGVYIDDIPAWCEMDFGYLANPLYYAHNLYLNGNLVTDLTIPDGVTHVGSSAFENCTSLTKVTVPDSVISIGASAFAGCLSLESMTLPFVGGSVKTSEDTYQYPFGYIFGQNDYDGCVEITQYYYGESTSTTRSNVYYIPEKLRSVTITGGNILYGAFSNCNMLTNIVIPEDVTSICVNAFSACTSLTSFLIPDSVTSIGGQAFYGCTSLTTIAIPDSVTAIGDYAFRDCTSLTGVYINDISIWCEMDFGYLANPLYYAHNLYLNGNLVTDLTIPDGVTHVGSSAFENCTSLTKVTVPDSVISIGASAFAGCLSLESMTLPFVGDCVKTSEDTYQYPFGYIFGEGNRDGCVTIIQYYYGESISTTRFSYYSIPESLRSVTITGGNILCGAFSSCSMLTNIVIPEDVTSISNNAFSACTSLTSFLIPDSVTSIGEQAFSGCHALKSVTIGNGVTSIGDYAFQNCSELIEINYNATQCADLPSNHYNYIFRYAGENGEGITVNISANVKSIPAYLFYPTYKDSPKIVSVVFSDNSSCESIGDYAFCGCGSLTNITIPNSVTSIGDYAFANCNAITIYSEAVSKPSGWSDLWASHISGSKCPVVWNCNSNETADDGYIYTIIDGIRYALKDETATVAKQSSSLSGDITIPINIIYKYTSYSVKSIEYQAFSNCSSLTSVTISYGITSIGSSAFSGCTSLNSITIPNSVTSIGSSAFSDCTSLTSLTIPNSVTSIESFTFSGCTSLTSVTLPNSVTSIGSSAFSGCNKLIQIENDVSYVGKWVVACNTSVTSVSLRTDTKGIAIYAFNGCSSLTSITLPESITIINSSAFFGCKSITDINFNGTKAQWDAILKDYYWISDAGDYTIHCTDGDVAKS